MKGVTANQDASGQVAARWGEAGPPPVPRRITAGPLAFDLCGADVENVRYGGVDVLRALRMVVRDRNWGTVPGRVERAEVSGPVVSLRVRHGDDFAWTGRLEASPGGLTASFEGEALREFARNRIGWCLLHPLALAGTAVEVETPGGAVREGTFPERISPHQPLRDIRALRYAYGGATVEIAFAGDVFETEDQRNWTDASYKTYSTPLDLPFPVTLGPGERVAQRVTIRVTGDPAPAAPPPEDRVVIGEPGAPLPPIGFTVPHAPGPAERARLDAVRPAFLHVELDADGAWRPALDAASAEAARLGVPLRAAVFTSSADRLPPVLAALRAAPVAAVAAYDAATHVTTPELARVVAGELPGIRLGGGTRAHFAELNRATDLPLDRLDEVGYSIAAQMHAEDRASVRETLQAQPVTVRDARRIAGGKPVVVGPVGFRPRFNAVATDAGGPAITEDPRRASVFGAAWTVGTLAALSSADAVILYPAGGLGGDPPYPLWTVLAAMAKLPGARVRDVRTPPGIAALALHADAGDLLLVANLRDTPADLGLGEPAWLLAADPGTERGWSFRPARADRLPAPSVAVRTTLRMEGLHV